CIPLAQEEHTKICSTDTNRILQHGVEDRLKLASRRTDDAQHFRCGLLSLQRLITLAAKALGLTFRADSWRTAALWRRRLSPSRFDRGRTCSGAPSHRPP